MIRRANPTSWAWEERHWMQPPRPRNCLERLHPGRWGAHYRRRGTFIAVVYALLPRKLGCAWADRTVLGIGLS